MTRKITRLPTPMAADLLERALLEIDVAISHVLAGAAVTITLCCDAAEGAASTDAVRAQTAGVVFRLLREPALRVSLAIGPRLRPLALAAADEMGS